MTVTHDSSSVTGASSNSARGASNSSNSSLREANSTSTNRVREANSSTSNSAREASSSNNSVSNRVREASSSGAREQPAAAVILRPANDRCQFPRAGYGGRQREARRRGAEKRSG